MEEVLTTVPKEVKNFIWKIKDVSVILYARPIMIIPTPFEFDIGKNIGLPSTWKIQLTPALCHADCLTVSVTRTGAGGESKETASRFICTALVKRKDDPDKFLTIQLDNNSSSKKFDIENYDRTGDELVFHVKFVMYSNVCTTTTKKTLVGGEQAMMELYGRLLKSGDLSDFLIKVKEGDGDGEYLEIKVHKAILGGSSAVFQKMLESPMNEAQTGILVIEDLSPACVNLMLKYIYTGKLEDDWKNVPEDIVRAADKYNLPLLLDFLNQNLHSACSFANAMKLRKLANLYEFGVAVNNINYFIASNIAQIE